MDINIVYLLQEQENINPNIKIKIISKEEMNKMTTLNHQIYYSFKWI